MELARCKRFSSPKHLLGHSRGSGVLRPSQVPSLVSTFRTGSTGSHCCHPCSKADGFRPEVEVTTSEVKPAWALSAPSRRAAGPFSAKTSGLRVASSHGKRQAVHQEPPRCHPASHNSMHKTSRFNGERPPKRLLETGTSGLKQHALRDTTGATAGPTRST